MEGKIESEIRRKFPEETLEKILSSFALKDSHKFREFKNYWDATNIELVEADIEFEGLYLIFRSKEISNNYTLFQISENEAHTYFFNSENDRLFEVDKSQYFEDKTQLELVETLKQVKFKKSLDKKEIIKLRTINENIALAYNTTIARYGVPINIVERRH